jgi:hypothetical protein
MSGLLHAGQDCGKKWNAAALTKLIEVLNFLPASKPKRSTQNK